jgi:hypothetical protein
VVLFERGKAANCRRSSLAVGLRDGLGSGILRRGTDRTQAAGLLMGTDHGEPRGPPGRALGPTVPRVYAPGVTPTCRLNWSVRCAWS